MKPSSLRYLIVQGWKSLIANRLMTLASIGVLTACLIITGIAGLITVNVNRIIDYAGSHNEIRVWFDEELPDESIETLGNQILHLENVASMEYVTRDTAFDEARDLLGDKAYLIDGYEGLFPPSFRVFMVDQELAAQTNAQIRTFAGVESTDASVEVGDIIVTIQRAVTYGGGALVIVLALVSIIVISNTIRLTVFARRREIGIMKYVGATNAFIRLPFFVEGMSVGILSGAIASGIVSLAYNLVFNYLQEIDEFGLLGSMINQVMPLSDVWEPVLLIFLLFGVVIGGIGCATSIRKHLKV